eukprot:766435-Hanusia_phi.AAC.3
MAGTPRTSTRRRSASLATRPATPGQSRECSPRRRNQRHTNGQQEQPGDLHEARLEHLCIAISSQPRGASAETFSPGFIREIVAPAVTVTRLRLGSAHLLHNRPPPVRGAANHGSQPELPERQPAERGGVRGTRGKTRQGTGSAARRG